MSLPFAWQAPRQPGAGRRAMAVLLWVSSLALPQAMLP